MNDSLWHSWWAPALRGAVAVLFGILVLFWPGLTLLALVSLFAAYALLGGVVSVIGAVKNRRRDDHWWLLLLIGLVGIGAGVITWMHPAMTTLLLVLLIGANAMVTGMLDIVAAIRLRKEMRGEWLLLLSGVTAVAFGVLVFLFPAAGALVWLWLIGLYAFVTGVLLLGLAFRLRRQTKTTAATQYRQDRRVTRDRRVSSVPAHP